jgi:hypothetical protein
MALNPLFFSLFDQSLNSPRFRRQFQANGRRASQCGTHLAEVVGANEQGTKVWSRQAVIDKSSPPAMLQPRHEEIHYLP